MRAPDKEYQLIGIDEWIISQGQAILGTTLGSCVSLCLWDAQTKTGGLNHFLLPNKPGKRMSQDKAMKHHPAPQEYQHEVIEILIEQMLSLGIPPGRIRALVVGGGKSQNDFYQVGEKNLNIALKMLEVHGITQVQVSGGGMYSRKVHFYVQEGKVVIRKFDLSHHRSEIEETLWL